MRATLHDPTPNTYYGQWLVSLRPKTREMLRSIVHHERAASVGFVAFGAAARDFPGNRSPVRWKFVCRPKRKSARLAL
jgi:hypothetical protein